jgi:hypothetical protein
MLLLLFSFLSFLSSLFFCLRFPPLCSFSRKSSTTIAVWDDEATSCRHRPGLRQWHEHAAAFCLGHSLETATERSWEW